MQATADQPPADHRRRSVDDRIGVLLVNSGTPDSPSTRDVRRFLAGLLGDPRVVELPRWLWWPILHGIILRTRPFRSARKYRKIWTAEGSPLLRHGEALRTQVERELGQRVLAPLSIEIAMLYARPSVESALRRMRDAGARRILVVPMFPQYSGVSTGAVFDQVTQVLRGWRWLPELRFVSGYHDHPAYLRALKDSVLAHWRTHGRTRHLVMAFHGIPQKYFDKGDPYYCFCQKTGRLLAEELGLPDGDWTVTFQSRFGPGRWLQPYTDEVIKSLPGRGIVEVTVVSPGFAADCLETLEELALEARQRFAEAGGARFEYVPALNSDDAHARMFADLIERHLSGWLFATRPGRPVTALAGPPQGLRP
jgi:ferrochelatase